MFGVSFLPLKIAVVVAYLFYGCAFFGLYLSGTQWADASEL